MMAFHATEASMYSRPLREMGDAVLLPRSSRPFEYIFFVMTIGNSCITDQTNPMLLSNVETALGLEQ